MPPIADHTEARRAIRRYMAHAEGKLPDDTFARLEELADSPSPVDQLVGACELLYARRDEIDQEGQELVEALAAFAALNGFHGMATDNRGGLIAQAMRRDSGAKVQPGVAKPQKAEHDPEPQAPYVKAKPPAEAPADDTAA
jgi:hypothetical protein